GPALGATGFRRDFAGVLIRRVSQQFGDGGAAGAPEAHTQGEAAVEGVGAVEVQGVAPVGVQVAGGELVEQVLVQPEVVQGGDVGVILPVVVPVQALVIAPQFGKTVVGQELEALGEAL